MGKSGAKAQKQKRGPKKTKVPPVFTWVVVLAVLGLVAYGFSRISGIAYTDRDIAVVNFSGLDAKQKTVALKAANAARCGCGCGLGLAQCVATDPSCPIREDNINLIKGMVRNAMASPAP